MFRAFYSTLSALKRCWQFAITINATRAILYLLYMTFHLSSYVLMVLLELHVLGEYVILCLPSLMNYYWLPRIVHYPASTLYTLCNYTCIQCTCVLYFAHNIIIFSIKE